MCALRNLAAITLLLSSISAMAEYWPSDSMLPQTQAKRWQDVDNEMSTAEYRDSSRQNLRLIRQSAQEFVLQLSNSAGIPRQGVELTGAALGLIVQGAKINLNESRTMAVRFDEVANDDRAVSIRIKLDW